MHCQVTTELKLLGTYDELWKDNYPVCCIITVHLHAVMMEIQTEYIPNSVISLKSQPAYSDSCRNRY